MSDLVKRLRYDANVSSESSDMWQAFDCSEVMNEAADKIEQLERELDQLTAEWKDEMELRMSIAQELRAEKALADRLIVAGTNALQNYTLFIKKFSDDWDDALAAYRKARGL